MPCGCCSSLHQLPIVSPLPPVAQLVRDINAGRFASGTTLVLVSADVLRTQLVLLCKLRPQMSYVTFTSCSLVFGCITLLRP